MHSWIFEDLRVIFFWVWVIWKKVECELEKYSLNNFICHLSFLKKLSPTHTHLPHIHSLIYLKPYKLLFHVFESFIKGRMWIGKKIHSIMLSVTCHGFRNFPPTHTHPLVSIKEFLKPCNWLFLKFELFVKNWIEIEKNITQ